MNGQSVGQPALDGQNGMRPEKHPIDVRLKGTGIIADAHRQNVRARFLHSRRALNGCVFVRVGMPRYIKQVSTMQSEKKQYNAPTQQEIAVCAYHIWEREGKLPGNDVVHWLQAEKQLIADRKQDAGLLSAARSIQLVRQRKNRMLTTLTAMVPKPQAKRLDAAA